MKLGKLGETITKVPEGCPVMSASKRKEKASSSTVTCAWFYPEVNGPEHGHHLSKIDDELRDSGRCAWGTQQPDKE